MRIRFLPLLFLPGILNAQNLVSNNSFNTYSPAPDSYAEMCRATGWSSATGACVLVVGSGSPDYYNTAGSGGANPPNTFWATVNPHSGGGMAGLAPWYASPNFREYIRCQLSSPLVVGTTYEVSMWLTNAISTIHGYGCNNMGVYFSSTPTNQSGGLPITSVTPQCEMTSVFWNTNWQQITFYYTASAAYQYMCIGNFHNDAGTIAVMHGSGTSGCYVYIDDVVVQPIVALPIQLISFTAELDSNNTVGLKWETASELNNDYFAVERSPDGERFETIGKVGGHGTTAENHEYAFTDEHPMHGLNYYRIGQIDFNGSQTYSQVRMVEVNLPQTEIQLLVSPNPASSNANIIMLVANDCNSVLEISMIDISGRIVFRENISSQSPADNEVICYQQFQFSSGDLASGLYFIKVVSGNNLIASEKLLVQ
ncbi:MAG TPA: T9SS type A sorting domain-containing protein [Chitinophagales bacterium]|nr:T9SS type A sorting domain-containing protein [Chitinophagales bacterium]